VQIIIDTILGSGSFSASAAMLSPYCAGGRIALKLIQRTREKPKARGFRCTFGITFERHNQMFVISRGAVALYRAFVYLPLLLSR
jgi:hypothetical protein